MIKYKNILTIYVKTLDEALKAVAIKVVTPPETKLEKVAILSSIGKLGQFNSDFGKQLIGGATKAELASFAELDPENAYTAKVTKRRVEDEPSAKVTMDAITELVNELENLTIRTRTLTEGVL